MHLIFHQVLYCSQTAWEGILISSADLHNLNSCSTQKMNHLQAFITLSKSPVAPACPPMKSLISFRRGIKLSLNKAAFQWGIMLVLWEQTPPGVPQTCYLSIVTAQIFSKQLTENRLYASAFYLKDMLEMLFREDMSRLHFWCCITTWVQLISNYKGKQGEEDWEGRSWAENRWKCCWLPPVHTHCQKQGHAILSALSKISKVKGLCHFKSVNGCRKQSPTRDCYPRWPNPSAIMKIRKI